MAWIHVNPERGTIVAMSRDGDDVMLGMSSDMRQAFLHFRVQGTVEELAHLDDWEPRLDGVDEQSRYYVDLDEMFDETQRTMQRDRTLEMTVYHDVVPVLRRRW